jgi:hypothetical protein
MHRIEFGYKRDPRRIIGGHKVDRVQPIEQSF